MDISNNCAVPYLKPFQLPHLRTTGTRLIIHSSAIMCQYFFPWTCNLCSIQNHTFNNCRRDGTACPSSGIFYPLPPDVPVACGKCKRLSRPPTMVRPGRTPSMALRASLSQLSAFCDLRQESGQEATLLAESRSAAYNDQRSDVFQQARTNQGASQGSSRSTAWESAWYELEVSLCERGRGGAAQGKPWSVSEAAI